MIQCALSWPVALWRRIISETGDGSVAAREMIPEWAQLAARRVSGNTAIQRGTLWPSSCSYAAVQSQNAVSAYFASKQILPFGFTERYVCESRE